MNEKVNLVIVDYGNSYGRPLSTQAPLFSILRKVVEFDKKEVYYELALESKCRDFVGSTCLASNLRFHNPLNTNDKNRIASIDEALVSISINALHSDLPKSRIGILNDIEREMGITPTTVHETNVKIGINGRKKLVFIGDSLWMKSPHAISIYTFLIRCLCYPSDKSITTIEELFNMILIEYTNSNDASFIFRFLPYIDIRFYLINLDRILGKNPLTGMNDEELTNTVFSIESSSFGQYSMDHQSTYSNKYIRTNYRFSLNVTHPQSGIVHITYLLTLIEKGTFMSDMSESCMGLDWVSNYIDLAIEKGIFKSVKVDEKESFKRITKTWENNDRKK